LLVRDVRQDSRFANHPMLKIAPHIKSFMAMQLPDQEENSRGVLFIVNPKKSAFADPAIWRQLSNFVNLFHLFLELESENATGRAGYDGVDDAVSHLAFDQHNGVAQDIYTGNGDPAQSNVNFLFDTLIKKRVLHSRKGVDYITLRAWRAQMKPYQISTLVSLKQTKPEIFIRRAAEEISKAAQLVHGEGVIRHVVPIPGGSSGDAHCLSVLLAQEVAANLNIPFRDVLRPQIRKGKSAPIKSANLKPYELTANVDGPILVVDDVSSSGTHMELAVNALRNVASAVYGIAWIGK
jgi:hypothetical protein